MTEVVVHGVLEDQVDGHRNFCMAGGGTFSAQQDPNGTFSVVCVFPDATASTSSAPASDSSGFTISLHSQPGN